MRRRRAAVVPSGLPMGQFGRNPVDPHNLTGAVARELANAMTDDPGLRLAGSRGKRTFRGGGLDVQRFAGPSGPAQDQVLELLPTTRIQRRAMGTFRGTPWSPGTPTPADRDDA